MGLAREHEMHKRRFSRNVGLGVVLAGFVALIFGLTVAKVSQEAFDIKTMKLRSGDGMIHTPLQPEPEAAQ